LILFDKRGTGMLDRVPDSNLPTLEERMDDVRAVMDAAGSERAALFGQSEGASMAILFAATYPERTTGLVTFGAFACRAWQPDYPWGPTAEQRGQFFDLIERDWGGDMDIATMAPSMADDEGFQSPGLDLPPTLSQPGRRAGTRANEHRDRRSKCASGHPRSHAHPSPQR